MDEDKYYIDENGYKRFNDSDKLVHRWVAYKYIYKDNKNKYKYNFEDYIVYHIDKNKLNNNSSNLKLMLTKEHEAEHGIIPARADPSPFVKIVAIFIIIIFVFYACSAFII